MKNNVLKLTKVLLIAALVASAPIGIAIAAYEDIGVGARATGLGSAFTAVADDAYAVHYNPAGLGLLYRPELATSYSKLLTGMSDNSNLQNSFLGYAHPLKGGDQGVVGLAWNYLSLDSLYRETVIYGSYGRALFAQQHPNKLYGGINLKYLNRGLGTTSAANNPLGPTGAVVSGAVDPVLQNAAKTNMDVDLGLLYRVQPRWTLGLMMQHFLEPDIAFSGNDSDKLKRNYKLGGAYKTPFSTLSSDLDFNHAPDGSMDKVLAVGAEKWLPTLVYGTFGIRGSLGVGTRSTRQIALGLSYKIYRMQFDYGFALPLGGLTGSYGSHRLGISFRFGNARQAEPVFAEALLENMRELSEIGSPEFRYQTEEYALFKRTAVEHFLQQAGKAAAAGRFASALVKLDEAAAFNPADSRLAEQRGRLKIVADIYAEVSDFATDAVQAALYQGIISFLAGQDKKALGYIDYAQSLNPQQARLETLLKALETAGGLRRPSAPAPAPAVVVSTPTAPAAGISSTTAQAPAAPSTATAIAGPMALMEVALAQLEYGKVIELANQVLKIDGANGLAYKRMGAAYYSLKKFPEALKALNSAYELEQDPAAKKTLQGAITSLVAMMKKKPKAPTKALSPATATPRDIERLYDSGVELYAQGRLSEAARMFRKMLEWEPDSVSARRALKRVEAELLQSGDKR
ncbi:MAG: hypothetical protein A3J74_08680 [Elusimicrobia bacterium RIFCSPHIGHO2_02_FULL_57_9]|nr:MAG: hypothetical protein A3J74_08680 [Elusimicrobia bacterium RIFCSPHIGHO2_02_FULL_57_9]